MKRSFSLFFLLFSFLPLGQSCAVCLGDFSDEEVFAYGFSVVFLIALMFFTIFFIYRKIKQNYDFD